MNQQSRVSRRRGMSMLEIMAAVTLVGIVALIVVPRFAGQSTKAKVNACEVNKNNVEVQAQLWFRNKGKWPNSNLKDLAADSTYFTDGLPTCPVDGSSYTFDATTQRVVGHNH